MASRGVNKVILLGNVGKDPESRFMTSGEAVTSLSLATSETWKDKNTGQPQERTEWHKIVFFGRLAEIVNEYVRSGTKLYVEGALRTRKFQKDGIDRYSTEIVASEMQLLDSRTGGPAAAQTNEPTRTAVPAQSNPAPADSFEGGFMDEDIPFMNPYKNMEFMV